jgi:hypothetical protein
MKTSEAVRRLARRIFNEVWSDVAQAALAEAWSDEARAAAALARQAGYKHDEPASHEGHLFMTHPHGYELTIKPEGKWRWENTNQNAAYPRKRGFRADTLAGQLRGTHGEIMRHPTPEELKHPLPGDKT